MSSYLIFSVNNNKYALTAENINTTITQTEIIKLPEMPLYFIGHIKYSDMLIPVLDVYQIFYNTLNPNRNSSQIILIKNSLPFGIHIDQVIATTDLKILPNKDKDHLIKLSKKQYICDIGESEHQLVPILNVNYLSSLLYHSSN